MMYTRKILDAIKKGAHPYSYIDYIDEIREKGTPEEKKMLTKEDILLAYDYLHYSIDEEGNIYDENGNFVKLGDYDNE